MFSGTNIDDIKVNMFVINPKMLKTLKRNGEGEE